MVASSELFAGDRTFHGPIPANHELTPVQMADRFEAYKQALNKSVEPDQVARTTASVRRARGQQSTPADDVAEAFRTLERYGSGTASLTKSASPDVLSSLTASLTAAKGVMADLGKDWSSANPLASGLVAYDLQAPAKFLVPRMTPIRNRTPRSTQGVGTTARYKVITGISNAQVGGVANLTTFFNSESVSTTFGGVTGLRRPPKINYAAVDKTVMFMEQGLSDSVTVKAFYQSQGYENLRQLSDTALLWASLLGEEQSLLFARGTTGNGFTGVIAAPTGVAAVAAAAAAGQTGNTANVANVFIYVQPLNGLRGAGAVSTVLNSTALSAVTGDVLNVSWTDSAGATGYAVYAGTTTGIANAFLYGTTQSNKFTMQFTGAGTGGTLNAGTQTAGTDSSADGNAYDGFVTVLSNPAVSGYVSRLNAAFSTTNPGTEFQTAFNALYTPGNSLGSGVMADPDVIWIYPQGRIGLSDALKGSSSSNYRLIIENTAAGNIRLGSIVNGLVNEITGKMVDLEVHPYLSPGVALIHSETLPIPDSEVSSTVEVRNVVDYTRIDWTQIQLTYDASTYWLGSPVFYAPAWSGAILGITN